MALARIPDLHGIGNRKQVRCTDAAVAAAESGNGHSAVRLAKIARDEGAFTAFGHGQKRNRIGHAPQMIDMPMWPPSTGQMPP